MRDREQQLVELLDHLASTAESYGAENLYLARRDEGYVGDPKEFRFSEIYARRIPTYKHELLIDYIDEASRSPHERLGRRLTPAEVDWMQRRARKLLDDDLAHATKTTTGDAMTRKTSTLSHEVEQALSEDERRGYAASRGDPRTAYAYEQLVRARGARLPRQVIPGISAWNKFAGGSAAAPDKYSYTLNVPEGEYHVDPVNLHGRHTGYRLRFAARRKPRGGHEGLWHDLGTQRSPSKSAVAARRHYAASY